MKIKRILLLLITVLFSTLSKASVNDSFITNDLFYRRIQQLNIQLPIIMTLEIKRKVYELLRNNSGNTGVMIGKMEHYQLEINKEFTAINVPKELKYIALANTNFDLLYKSTEGSSGIWPLNYFTAKKYGLEMNSYVDERNDIQLSSRAAAKYFKELYEIYKDWHLAIAAFSAGPIAINKAIRLSGNVLDYFKIKDQLPLESKNCVENFYASMYVSYYYNEHNLQPVKYRIVTTDTVMIQNSVSFARLCSYLLIPQEVLKQINPVLKNEEIGKSILPYALNLPKDEIGDYHNKISVIWPPPPPPPPNLDSLFLDSMSNTMDSSQFFLFSDSFIFAKTLEKQKQINPKANPIKNQNSLKVPNQPIKNQKEVLADKNLKVDDKSKAWVNYTIKKGDTPSNISDVFDCTLKETLAWNKIKEKQFVAGKKIKFQVQKSKLAQYQKINKMTMDQKRKLAKKQ